MLRNDEGLTGWELAEQMQHEAVLALNQSASPDAGEEQARK